MLAALTFWFVAPLLLLAVLRCCSSLMPKRKDGVGWNHPSLYRKDSGKESGWPGRRD